MRKGEIVAAYPSLRLFILHLHLRKEKRERASIVLSSRLFRERKEGRRVREMSDAKCLFKGTDDDDDDDDNRRDGYSDTLTHTHTHPRMNDLAFQPPCRQL